MPVLHTAFDEFCAHYGEVSQVIISPDGRHVFTTGADGTIFVFAITEYLNEHEPIEQNAAEEEKIQTESFSKMIVDNQLADIVLVKKQDMEEWRKKQEQLRQEMEETSARVESTIADVKNSFKKQMTDQEISHKKEKKNLEERLKNLMNEKEHQQHKHSQDIKSMELNHIEMN